MEVQGQKNENGKNVLELGYKRQLVLTLGVKDIGRRKAHLISDYGTAEFDGSENKSGNEAEQGAEQHLVGHQQAKVGWVLGQRWNIGRYHGENGQGDKKGQAKTYPHRGLLAAEHRGGADQGGNPRQAEDKCLAVFKGEESDVQD